MMVYSTDWLVKRIDEARKNEEYCSSYKRIFEDEEQYWLIEHDGTWTTLDKKKPQWWIVEELIHEYIAILYVNGEIKHSNISYTISEDAKQFTLKR